MPTTDQLPDSRSSFGLLERSRSRDEETATALFARYFDRLARLAKSRLSSQTARRIDPEDVVMSAFRSFFLDAREGRYVLSREGDLWRLLAAVTKHKLLHQTRFHRAARRSIDREAPLDEARLIRHHETAPDVTSVDGFASGLSPFDARVLGLRSEEKPIAEIAREAGCSERTVRRSFSRVRAHILERRAPVAGETPTPPSVLLEHGDFLLQRMVGAGRMGKVFQAWQRSENRPVAVKFLRKTLIYHPGAMRRFLDEARIVAGLRHPRIVATHGLGRTPGGSYFLVMEFVAGSNLDLPIRRSAIPWEQAARWVAEACEALEHAHSRGVVHCDLKPANLLLDPSGGVRVTDFGLARHLSDPPGHGVRVEGTAPYMAPEQASPRRGSIDVRTDVYGLGAVLSTLLTGRPRGSAAACGKYSPGCSGTSPSSRPTSYAPISPRESWTSAELASRSGRGIAMDRLEMFVRPSRP